MNITRTIDDIIGRKVKTGSPGYENLEWVENIRTSDAWPDGERILIEFESGYTTNMSPQTLKIFLAEGEVEYTRWFRSNTDKALETIALAQPLL